MIQYYRDLWFKRSHILQQFTEVSQGKKGAKIVAPWGTVHVDLVGPYAVTTEQYQ